MFHVRHNKNRIKVIKQGEIVVRASVSKALVKHLEIHHHERNFDPKITIRVKHWFQTSDTKLDARKATVISYLVVVALCPSCLHSQWWLTYHGWLIRIIIFNPNPVILYPLIETFSNFLLREEFKVEEKCWNFFLGGRGLKWVNFPHFFFYIEHFNNQTFIEKFVSSFKKIIVGNERLVR